MPKKNNIFQHYPFIQSKQRYRVRARIGDKVHPITGRTPDEIDAKYTALLEAHNAGLALNSNTTLIQYAREWYPIKAARLTPKSAEVYQNAINNHIAPFFGNTKLCDVRPLHIEKFMATKTSLANSTQAKILFTLSQIMRSAEKNGLIMKNPCNGIKAGGEPAKVKTPLTTKQQKTLSEAVTGTRAEIFVLLCLYAGLRREEALGLMWDNVHLDSTPYIDVRHTVTYDKNRPIHAAKLKSKAAYRSIPIPTILSSALLRAKPQAESNIVIPALKSKEAMSIMAFRRMWEIAVKSVDFHIEPHILRHTYITELCASGMDIKKIQYLAGHENVNLTLKIYAHVKNNRPEELAETINNIFPKKQAKGKKYKLTKRII